MPTEASLLAQIAVNILTTVDQLPEGSASLSFLTETASKLLLSAANALHRPPSGSPGDSVLLPNGNGGPLEAPAGSTGPAAGATTGVEEADSVLSHTRRDFTRWCKTLSLPANHPFYTVGGGQSKVCFKLVWGRDGKALLETTCPDGVILRGLSPTGILKAYLKKITGKEANVDGWKRLSMRSPDGLTQWPIREAAWMDYQWVDGKFVSDEKGIHSP